MTGEHSREIVHGIDFMCNAFLSDPTWSLLQQSQDLLHCLSKIKVPIPYSTPLIVVTFRSKGHVQLSLHYEYTAVSAQCLWRIFWWSLSNPRIKQCWLMQQLHCFFIKEKDFERSKLNLQHVKLRVTKPLWLHWIYSLAIVEHSLNHRIHVMVHKIIAGSSTCNLGPLSGRPMPAATSASIWLCGAAPSIIFTLNALNKNIELQSVNCFPVHCAEYVSSSWKQNILENNDWEDAGWYPTDQDMALRQK